MTCVVDLCGSQIDAMMNGSDNAAKNIETCRIEIRNTVSLVTATTDRVGALEEGFARLEAQVAPKPSSSTARHLDGRKSDNGQSSI